MPPTAADLGAFAYRVEMFGVMLLNFPKDCSDFLRAAFKLILRFGEFVLRLRFQRGDLVCDCNGVEICRLRTGSGSQPSSSGWSSGLSDARYSFSGSVRPSTVAS